MYLDLRKKAATKAFELGGGGWNGKPTINETTIIEYVKPFAEKSWKGVEGALRHKVACVATRRGNERASRAEMELTALMPDTPDAHAAFAEALRLAEIAAEAHKAAAAALDAVPRLALEDISELVRIKQSEAA